MRKHLAGKRIVIILSLCAVCAIFCVPSIASSITQTATLIYRDIQIVLNGETVTPKDANGNTVEPFIIDGTTYLPVRAIASALNLEVSWNDTTSTVTLTQVQEGSGQSVYITRTGKKYHYDGTCNGGTYWPVPFDTAVGMGLGPCDKCVN